MSRPTAIDPSGCRCTECLTGEYVPLDWADAKQVNDALAGRISDHTSGELTSPIRGAEASDA